MLELLGTTPDLLAAAGIAALWGTLKNYLLVIGGFSLVIFFHEVGHFAVAKWAGIRVERFAVGFGPELFGFTYGQTRYSFNILPLGGYVKMLGQEDFEVDSTGELTIRDDPDAFSNKPVGHRMAVVSAGVVMNLILAAVLFMVVYMVGRQELSPVVGLLQAGSPAADGGLRVGDEIVDINDAPIDSFDHIMMAVVLADPFEPLRIRVLRDGTEHALSITPRVSEVTQLLHLGIGPANTTTVAFASAEPSTPGQGRLAAGDRVVAVNGAAIGEDDGLNMWAHVFANRQEPAEFVVERGTSGPDGTAERVTVRVDKAMTLMPNGRARIFDLLGMVPRLRIDEVLGRSAAHEAGLMDGDVIERWGLVDHPTAVEVWESTLAHRGHDIPVMVRRGDRTLKLYYRPRVIEERHPLPPTGLTFEDRELPTVTVVAVRPESAGARAGLRPDDRILSLNGTVRPDVAAVRAALEARKDLMLQVQRGNELLPIMTFKPAEPDTISVVGAIAPAVVVGAVEPNSRADLAGLRAGDIIRRWENLRGFTAATLGAHAAEHADWDADVWTERRRRPIRLKTFLEPKLGFRFARIEDAPLIVADVLKEDEILLRPTAASHTALSKGCRILEADGVEMTSWAELAEYCRTRGGRDVDLTFVPAAGGVPQHAVLPVPRSLSTILDLPPTSASLQTFNLLLDGQSEVEIELRGDRNTLSTYAPAAVSLYLAERVGQTVTVSWPNRAGVMESADVLVTEDMVDAWYRRVAYSMPVAMRYHTYLNRHTSPFSAIWAGTTQTFYSVAKAYRTFQRMIFDRSVGIEKVSGPVGILNIGSQVAEHSFLDLLWFLAFLSANLAVINFLPLPIVDGGLMVFLLIEKIKGSPVSLRVQIATQVLGLALIVTTFLLVTFNDISNLMG